jgi:hypothetical protein
MAWPGLCVDPAQPLCPDHPLNQQGGLASEWSVLPAGQWSGGKRFCDLDRRRRNDGTLTNFASPNTAASGWNAARGRPGGFGSLTFDGTDDFVLLGALPPLLLTSPYPFTVAAWLCNNTASTAAANQTVFKLGASGGDSPRLFLRYESSAAGWLFDTGTTTLGTATPSAFPFAAGEWFHLAFTDTGSSPQYYKNGVPATTGGTGAVQALGASNESSWGRYRAGSTRYWGGGMDGLMIYDRALTASQVLALYQESRRGNPERWRWLGRRSYFLPVQTAVAGGLLLRRRRVLLGGAA